MILENNLGMIGTVKCCDNLETGILGLGEKAQ